MKTIYLLTVLVFVSSCCKDNKQTCGQVFNAGFSVSDYSQYLVYKPEITKLNTSYQTYYSPPDIQGLVSFGLKTKVNTICNADKPKIDLDIILVHPDSSINVIAYIQEEITNGQVTKIPIPANGIGYYKYFPYSFIGDYCDSPAAMTVKNEVQFHTHGSYSADSSYLFSNLASMLILITALKPE